MRGLGAAIRVLFRKNWRVLQRQSWLNQRRRHTPDAWLFPPLLSDVLVLLLLVYIVGVMCASNAALGPIGAAIPAEMEAKTPSIQRASAASMLTCLPLLLATTNMSVVLVERPPTRAFLAYMEATFPGDVALGIRPLSAFVRWMQVNDTTSERAIDNLLTEYPRTHDVDVYAGLDLRWSEEQQQQWKARVVLVRDETETPGVPTDQLEHYFSLVTSSAVDEREVQFPAALPLQTVINLFLRGTPPLGGSRSGVTSPSPETACTRLDTMLSKSGLNWDDLSPTQPLGTSMDSCVKAIRDGHVETSTLAFLARLVEQTDADDELKNLEVAVLPKRPRKTAPGQLETNIIFFMFIIFLQPFTRLVRDVVNEKEKQLKEYFLIMGLPSMALLISWFCIYFLETMVVIAISAVILADSMFAASAAGYVYYVLLLSIFAISILLFGIAITPMFSKAATSTMVAPLLFMVFASIPFLRSWIGDEQVDSTAWHYVLGFTDRISSPAVFVNTMHNILALDTTSSDIRPIEWTAVAIPITMMIFQCIGYLVLGWYLENVFPRTFGVQRKWNFVCLPSFWFPRFSRRRNRYTATMEEMESERVPLTQDQDHDTGDDVTLREMPLTEYVRQVRPILLVQEISYRYPNGKLAVENVSFGVKRGEIFGLLGPNGAGKSTTIGMLSGMLVPTGGDAFIGDISIAKRPEILRKSLSVCFQQNVLLDELTVWEHMKLVCDLKQTVGSIPVRSSEWEGKLQQFGLLEKRDVLSNTLSGGQKRKLSLVLALLDESKLILLDEPTAGMDLKARVDTWSVLKSTVEDRAVILTTHSMQEAQALCENIGIVAEGKLKCCGSSVFLREKYGVGYKLTIAHAPEQSDESSVRANTLLAAAQETVPTATIMNENKWETRLQLNNSGSVKISTLLKKLETMKNEGSIKSYAVTATDLEDVFVSVTGGGDTFHHSMDDTDKAHSKSDALGENSTPTTISFTHSRGERLSDAQVFGSQVWTLVTKRWKMMIRDKKGMFTQYVWAIVLFVVLLMSANGLSNFSNAETMTSLPQSASSSLLFVGALPSASKSTRQMLTDLVEPYKSRVVFYEVNSADEVLDLVLKNHTDDVFFGTAFVEHLSFAPEAKDQVQYLVFYNHTIERSLPVTLEWMSQAYCHSWKHRTTGDAKDCDLSVVRSAFPIRKHNRTDLYSDESRHQATMKIDTPSQDPAIRMLVAFSVLFTMTSIVSYYVIPVVKERELGLKRMQYLHLASTHGAAAYWTSHFIFDLICYLVVVIALYLTIVAFGMTWTFNYMLALGAITLLFGAASLVFTYLVSLPFGSHSSAQSTMSFVTMVQMIAVSVLFVLSMVPSTCETANLIFLIMEVLPLVAYGRGVLNLAMPELAPIRQRCSAIQSISTSRVEYAGASAVLSNIFPMVGDDGTPSPWSWDVSGQPLVFLCLSAVMFSLLLCVFDTIQMYPTVMRARVRRLLRLEPPEPDYGEEDGLHIIRAQSLTKVYNGKATRGTYAAVASSIPTEDGVATVVNERGQVVAIEDVSFAVERNDCVALLGSNGSGKSTTFEILTSGVAPTNGAAFINGINVTLNPQRASRQYGYCPQHNILFEEMSVREHLELFSRIRCREMLSPRHRAARLNMITMKLDLSPVEYTIAGELSGGNKRRLMLALSLLSEDVPLLLMDEPSAGVDVVARRLMWRILQEKRVSQQHVSCLFTTHSLEEAEAVCANAVVLSKGKVVWSSSLLELKQRVARGITITLRLDTEQLWKSEVLTHYTEHLQNQLHVSNTISILKMKQADVLCCELARKEKDEGSSDPSPYTPSPSHDWIVSLQSHLKRSVLSAWPSRSRDAPSMPVEDLIKAWLTHHCFLKIEADLFQAQLTTHSHEPVTRVDSLQGRRLSSSVFSSSTTSTYETNCTDTCTIADVFALLESQQQPYHIAVFTVSELSLERAFDQFA